MRSTVWQNSAQNGGGDAGAILNFGTGRPASLNIVNSTISGNNARLGGGVTSYNNVENSVTISNSTIAFNESGDRGSGGGLAIGSGSATVQNSIIAKNTSVSADNQNCSADPGSAINSSGYNIEDATDCGFTNIGDSQDTDPLLGALGFNGGETQTHPLLDGSPAIDSGPTECPAEDQRGVSRPQGAACDKGAFERQAAVPPDTTPPDTTIAAGPSEPSTDHTPTFAFGSTEPGSRFECSIDGGPFEPCSSPFTTGDLRAGKHTLAVRASTRRQRRPSPSVFEFEVQAERVEELPDPKRGETINVQEVAGTVFIGIPNSAAAARSGRSGRASQKGVTFVPLAEARQIPVGSFLDTRRGTVRLQSATNAAGDRQTGDFLSSIFQVRQSKQRSAKGLTDLVLKGGSFNRCGGAKAGSAPSASLSRRTIRRLRANAQGRFRTSGRNSSATVRGTRWETIDRCDGTLTKVQRGTVVVRDFRKKKNVVLKAGKSYLARARG